MVVGCPRPQKPQKQKGYLLAVGTMHRKLRLDFQTPSSYGPLAHVMAGLKRLLQHSVKKASAITPYILRNLISESPLALMCPKLRRTLTTFQVLSLLLFQSMLQYGPKRSSQLRQKIHSKMEKHRERRLWRLDHHNHIQNYTIWRESSPNPVGSVPGSAHLPCPRRHDPRAHVRTGVCEA